jgi:hypothetical protein
MTDRPVADRRPWAMIGQLLSALDDRNLSRAMRVLDPERAPDADQKDAPRCVRCATRGE